MGLNNSVEASSKTVLSTDLGAAIRDIRPDENGIAHGSGRSLVKAETTVGEIKSVQKVEHKETLGAVALSVSGSTSENVKTGEIDGNITFSVSPSKSIKGFDIKAFSSTTIPVGRGEPVKQDIGVEASRTTKTGNTKTTTSVRAGFKFNW